MTSDGEPLVASDVADAVATRFDGDYDDGIDAFVGGHHVGPTVTLTFENPDTGETQQFAAEFKEIK